MEKKQKKQKCLLQYADLKETTYFGRRKCKAVDKAVTLHHKTSSSSHSSRKGIVVSPVHINIDSIFKREHQTDGVVMEILHILKVITAKKMQSFTMFLIDKWMLS